MNLECIGDPVGMTTELRELARRRSVGSDVVLSWNPATRRVFVDVAGELDGAAVRIVVDGADALDAFNHPYAYLEAA
jgi:stage III sporulation protein SpoIIIAA